MTPDRDIELVLEAWLAPGASEMPEWLFDAVLERVERMPQRRRAGFDWRFRIMSSTIRVAAIAALALAIGLGTAPLWLPPRNDTGTNPSPSPSPSATNPPLDRLPSELRWTWQSPPRNVPELGANQDRALIEIDSDYAGAIVVRDSDYTADLSMGITKDGRLWLKNGWQPADSCAKGAQGFYDWSVSDDGQTLTITDGTDDCAGRRAFLVGTWTRWDCPGFPGSPHGWACQGVLAAGRHTSNLFVPHGGSGDLFASRPGGLSFEVPAGWADYLEMESSYVLALADEYDPTYQKNGWTISYIFVAKRPIALSADDPCKPMAAEGIGQDPRALADWLATHPGLDVLAREGVVIDGYQGLLLDVAMAADWTGGCSATDDPILKDLATTPFVPTFSYAPSVTPDGTWKELTAPYWDVVASNRHRFIFLDLGEGDTIVIDIASGDPAGQDALVQQAMPVVESFHFAE